MNFQDLKGVHEFISPEYDYLSPIYGFTLLGTKALENMRFYGNYGPKKEGVGCLEKATQIHSVLVKSKDCPQDKTSELLQRMFPSHDGANFVANQIGSDPVSHFGPELLGIVSKRLAMTQDSDLQDSKKVVELKEELKNLLYQELNPQSYYDNLRKVLTSRLKELKRSANNPPRVEQCGDKCHATEIEQLEKQIVWVKATLKELNPPKGDSASETSSSNSSSNSRRKGLGKEADFNYFADLLVEALKESRLPPRHYPKHLTEQILISYFWKKADIKEDFLPLLEGMNFKVDSARLSSFLSQKYSSSDFNIESLKKDAKEVATELLLNPEKLVFLAEQDKLVLKPFPPILSYGQAKHSSLGDSKYSDCGGTSLRNFLNIVLYDSNAGKFNPHNLTQLQKENPAFQIHPRLLSFYERHSDPAASVSQEVRDEWSEAISSGHKGVNYHKPVAVPLCEISSSGGGIDNMMVVLERLLFYDGTDSTKGSNPFHQAKERSEKLDVLCKTLSRRGFELDWSLSGTQDDSKGASMLNKRTVADIEFSINGKPSFIWAFRQGHFAITDIQQDKESWKDRIAVKFSQLIATDPSSQAGVSPLLLLWFASARNFDRLAITPAILIYSLPLSSNDVKLFAFKKIIEDKFDSLYPTAKRLQTMLPDDPYTQKEVAATLLEFDYPWGDPPHAIGKPDIHYKRVSGELRTLLVAQHGKSFGKAWIDPRGLIWGDVIERREDEAFHMMNHLQAKEYCKSHGASLPTKEEFTAVANDLGNIDKLNGNYIPQFLPYINKEPFWTSTVYDTNFGAQFLGPKGQIVSGALTTNGLVRCILRKANVH